MGGNYVSWTRYMSEHQVFSLSTPSPKPGPEALAILMRRQVQVPVLLVKWP